MPPSPLQIIGHTRLQMIGLHHSDEKNSREEEAICQFCDRAGFQAGDVIENVDGQTVSDFTDLIQIVQSKRVGEIITVAYRREGKQMKRDVELLPLNE